MVHPLCCRHLETRIVEMVAHTMQQPNILKRLVKAVQCICASAAFQYEIRDSFSRTKLNDAPLALRGPLPWRPTSIL